MIDARRDPASFRDPGGHVYVVDGQVFRTVMPRARDDYEFVRSTGLLQQLSERQLVIPAAEVPGERIQVRARAGASYVLQHPAIPFISYPYEWSFPALKAAALLTLDVHLDALARGVTLSDASAYNIQFMGPRPVFIDYLSFRRYRDGEFWIGHRQFCEQFLNPLLLTAATGVPHHAWYRGTLEGISAGDLSRVLPLRRKLSWNVLTHVVLQAGLSKPQATGDAARVSSMKFPLDAFRRMLRSLRRWIETLEPAGARGTIWADYAKNNSYTDEDARRKAEFVTEFVRTTRPGMLWDIGCNTGDYAAVALRSGARAAVGFEADHGALDLAYSRASTEGLSLLPLYLDAANPSPSQGWNEMERRGLRDRARADAVLALAVVHHLAIGRNVPLPAVVDWLIDLAPSGIIEFVPKSDPMVQRMLRLREDIFADYDESVFLAAVLRRAEIVSSSRASTSERLLVRYRVR